jgi:predicted negative regulator of RcsB-dependent stress response
MKKLVRILTIVTNFFIIAGVTRHWSYYDNTQLAAPQQEAAQVQEKAQNDTGCQSPYQNTN